MRLQASCDILESREKYREEAYQARAEAVKKTAAERLAQMKRQVKAVQLVQAAAKRWLMRARSRVQNGQD